MYRWGLVVAVFGVVACDWSRGGDGPAPELFPFVLPWDDASPGATDLSSWLSKPAGKLGAVHAGDDGHLYTGRERIRFFGVNFCFAANFPSKEDAPKIAARMAKFGINVVRLHHLDMFTFPKGIRARGSAATGELDPEALERLDFFIAQLQRHGIYANLNLLVSRPFGKADGLLVDVERLDWKDGHVAGFFHEPARKLQQDYARRLLTHRNPHIGRTYAEDPGVAFVEINNENGLIHAWLGGQVDRLPEVFLADLRRQWNAWLKRRHDTTVKLRQAWKVIETPLGEELLKNPHFVQGVEGWVLERHEQGQAEVTTVDDVPVTLRETSPSSKSARIAVTRKSSEGWHSQFNQSGLKVRKDRPYTLTFWARADKPLTMAVHMGMDHAPWKKLGLSADAKLGTEWKSFRFVFLPEANDDGARVNFSNLAEQTATVWLAGVSFRSGGVLGLAAEERLEDQAIPLFAHGRFRERTPEAQRDWLRFLAEVEDNYWQTMKRYLKEDLKARGVVVGTIVGCSTLNLMAKLDAVDTHAYWQHPHFPGRQWDPDDWVVSNRTMVNEPGGKLPDLALRRVLGKPHCVSEYNHPAPNTHGSEGFLLLAAYAALQDWDAIYAFAYAQDGDWNARRIKGFFDIDQHPTKMATLPAAVALFARGDVRPANARLAVRLDREQEINALRSSDAWELVHAGHVGVSRETALVHRVALVTDGGRPRPEPAGDKVVPGAGRYVSDTKELFWDLSRKGRGVVTVNTPRSKAVIGYGGGQRFDLGGVVIEPGATAQDGWCTVTVTAREGNLAGGPAQLLVTATGLAQNTGMKWKTAAKDSVGRDWGTAPSLVEGISARLTLPAQADRVRAWALDERGQRRTELPARKAGERQATFSLDPGRRTLWYEIEVR